MVLTTHVNPDGDGVGSTAALASRLRSRGIEATIITPSAAPSNLHFAFGDLPVFEAQDPAARDPLDAADLIAVLDTAERKRLGALAAALDRTDGLVIDHHPPVGASPAEPSIRDPSACATGELIFDLLRLDDDAVLTPLEADALYVAIVTDTGSFQFSNTSARTHEIAAFLVRAGVDPEAMYRALFGVYTRGGLALVQLALARLEVDPLAPVAWVSLEHDALRECGATSEDMEGLVEYPRRLAGIEVGALFRGLSSDRTKVSLRSNGAANVARIAQDLGGGGHEKAAGIVMEVGLEEAIRRVAERLRPVAREAAGADEGQGGR